MALYAGMGDVEEVVARDDPRLADYVDLRAGATPHAIVIAEGLLAVEQLVSSDYVLRSVLVTPKRLDRLPPVDAPVYVADESLLRETVGFDLHRGVVASADRPPPLGAASVLATDGPLLILEGVNDHENLGGLFRNARALRAGGVLLDPTTADPLYRRAVRVSLGHVLHIPFARLATWPDALATVREAGVTTVALTPAADAEPVDDVVRSVSGRVALLLGTEGPGLSKAALAAADRRARIPMADGVDSLNVATAAAVALFALAASRR